MKAVSVNISPNDIERNAFATLSGLADIISETNHTYERAIVLKSDSAASRFLLMRRSSLIANSEIK
jgi:hypothetical protein